MDNININSGTISLVLRRRSKFARVQWQVLLLNVKVSTNVSIGTRFDIECTRRASELETLVGTVVVYLTAHIWLRQWMGP